MFDTSRHHCRFALGRLATRCSDSSSGEPGSGRGIVGHEEWCVHSLPVAKDLPLFRTGMESDR